MTATNITKAFSPIGATNHSIDRQRAYRDYYATNPDVVKMLMAIEPLQKFVLEPMCGGGHISETLRKAGHQVVAFDIVDRGYGDVQDFLVYETDRQDFDIVSNPPYTQVEKYVEKCLDLMRAPGQKTCLLLRLLFLEGQRRRSLFDRARPARVWVSSSRIGCAKNGDFERSSGNTAMALAWFVWEAGYEGETVLKWFN